MTTFSPHIKLIYPLSAGSQADTLKVKLKHQYDTLAVDSLDFAALEKADPAELTSADLLVIFFDDSGFSDAVIGSIESFREEYKDQARILPIALDSNCKKPPEPLSGIRAGALLEQTDEEFKAIVNRTGALIGLWIKGGEKEIFISYRVIEAEAIAKQLQEHLKTLGFRAWLDKALDDYGQLNIKDGEEVQEGIKEQLKKSNLVLLLDTPRVKESEWIEEEVLLSVSGFVPLLPVVFRDENDLERGPRHGSLLQLRRGVDMVWRPDSSQQSQLLSEAELDTISRQMERYLTELAVYQLAVPRKVMKAFKDCGYDWKTLNERHRFYSAEKIHRRRITRMFSHCSLHSPEFRAGLDAFHEYKLPNDKRPNYRLFIYATTLIDDRMMSQLESECKLDDKGINILHLSELSGFLLGE